MVVNVCNPSNLETGAGGLFQIQRLVWDTQRIQGKQTKVLGWDHVLYTMQGSQNRRHREDSKPLVSTVKKTLFTGSAKEAEVG